MYDLEGDGGARCARLIGPAPDLLATLEAIQNAVFDYNLVKTDFGRDIGTMASQAIAKATGEPPQ